MVVKDAIPRKQGNNPHCEASKKRKFFRGGSRLTKCRKYSQIRRLIEGTMPQENCSEPTMFNARVNRLYYRWSLQLCDPCMGSKLGANQIDSILTTRSNDRIAHAQDK